MSAACWSSRAYRYSRSIHRQRRTPNLFLRWIAVLSNRRLSLHQQFQAKKGAPSGVSLLVHSVFVLRDGDFEVRSVAGLGFAVYLAVYVVNFVYSLFLPFYGYASSSSSPTGSSRSTKTAPPCCARSFVLDRAVKEDVCRTSDVVPSCPCTVMYSRRSSGPQPMGSGGDATPCKVTREDRRLYL